jgi:hypothetical protein
MKQRRSVIYLRIVFLCAFVSATPHVALAKPKGLGGGGQCACLCTAYQGGLNNISDWNVYNSQGSCGAFEHQTCTLENPYTGGVITGTLSSCSDWSDAGMMVVPPVAPTGGVKIVPQRR